MSEPAVSRVERGSETGGALGMMGLAFRPFWNARSLGGGLNDAAKTLDARFQWSKTWLLGIVGVGVYLAEKLKLLGWLADYMPWSR